MLGGWKDGLLKRLKEDEGNNTVFKPHNALRQISAMCGSLM
jgi:hypothetical protein